MLPSDALPCVWMTAGLVAYKLCDRAYDCEHCPLDTALRGVTTLPSREEQAYHQPRWEFRADRQYHAKHGWVLRLDDRRVRYGLDVFAARLLSHVSQVVLPTPKTRVCGGETACWVKDAEELIPLAAPITGIVGKVNRQVQTLPASISGSPYDDGWLLEILHDRGPTEDESLLVAEKMRVQSSRQLELLRAQAQRYLPHDRTVGPTLHDGGELVKDLRRILGSQRYHDLVRPMIG
jgi:glycine cleavage system H protein